jgi:hypothetical protein
MIIMEQGFMSKNLARDRTCFVTCNRSQKIPFRSHIEIRRRTDFSGKQLKIFFEYLVR